MVVFMDMPGEEDSPNHNGGIRNPNQVARYHPERLWRSWLIGKPLSSADALHQTVRKPWGRPCLVQMLFLPSRTRRRKHWLSWPLQVRKHLAMPSPFRWSLLSRWPLSQSLSANHSFISERSWHTYGCKGRPSSAEKEKNATGSLGSTA
jgi:hypothetical protein